MWPVEWHDEAEEELAVATDWYAEQNVSAAVAFANEVRDAILSIAVDPTRLPTLGPERHFYLLKRFPYLVVFRVLESVVQIMAVAHTSRRPGYWLHRDSGR
ncbi:MAG: type II toxin-antitoxin system RelE/ParE family toxin [Planctomycetaceae bacterium]|nr:type II toxin-antitoxin system RelE/ParE family toxin [Planctomycetaceae bacterium]